MGRSQVSQRGHWTSVVSLVKSCHQERKQTELAEHIDSRFEKGVSSQLRSSYVLN